MALARVLFAVGCALAIAACGSSTTLSAAAGSTSARQAIKYADCMRANGVPSFRDANPVGGMDIHAAIGTQSPAYVSAQRACSKLSPGPVPAGAPSDREQLGLLAAAKCMRRHGVNVGDPSFQGRYITLDVPDQATIKSPAFVHAEMACHYPEPTAAHGGAAARPR